MSSEKSNGVIVGLIIGGVIGAVTALMLTPKSGSELRKDLYQAYRDLEEKSEKMISLLKNKTNSDEEHSTAELIDRAQSLYNEAMESSAKLLQQIKHSQTNESTKKS